MLAGYIFHKPINNPTPPPRESPTGSSNWHNKSRYSSNWYDKNFWDEINEIRRQQQKANEDAFKEGAWTKPPKDPNFKKEPNTCRNCGNKFYGLKTENVCPSCKYGGMKDQWKDPRNEPKKTRQCVKCGHWKETLRVTSVFTCNECEWKEYEERRQRGEK